MTKLKTTQFRFHLGTATDVGKVRILNEDSFTVDPDVGLFIVADGVGGQNAGEVASQMVVEIIQNYVMSPQVPVTSVYSDVLPRKKTSPRLSSTRKMTHKRLAKRSSTGQMPMEEEIILRSS